MSTFNLSEEVSELTYNFEPHAGKGVIPEPSSMQIQAFRQALGELFSEAGTPEPGTSLKEDPEAFSKKLTEYLNRDTTEVDDKVLHMAADVCSNSPSFDELTALPYRARQAFLGWLTGVLLIPEGVRPATNT